MKEKEKISVPELPAGYTVEAGFVLPILLGSSLRLCM